jgi:hypothetical protein
MRTDCAFSLLITCALITGCAAPTATPETRPPIFTVAAEGEGNEITTSTQGNTLIVDVYSQSGIGSGTCEFVSGTPPQNIVFWLHLKGLEEFRLSYEGMTIIASVSSTANHEVIQSMISPESGEQPIDSDSPSWLVIREISDLSTSPAAPDSGYLEITPPKDFAQKGYRFFSIRWIDFYR